MAEAKHFIRTSLSINQIQTWQSHQAGSNTRNNHTPQLLKMKAASRKKGDHSSSSLLSGKIGKKGPRRHLITISTADQSQRWPGKWSCDYLFTLRDLHLADLVEDDQHREGQVHVILSIQKHASFGLSVEGKIVASLTRRCSNCSTPYSKRIDTGFNVWVLGSARDHGRGDGNDSSVIYVKPGSEANLDSLVQETIRLYISSSKATCSEACEKSEPTIQYVGRQYTASTKQRWQRLLQLRKPRSPEARWKCIEAHR